LLPAARRMDSPVSSMRFAFSARPPGVREPRNRRSDSIGISVRIRSESSSGRWRKKRSDARSPEASKPKRRPGHRPGRRLAVAQIAARTAASRDARGEPRLRPLSQAPVSLSRGRVRARADYSCARAAWRRRSQSQPDQNHHGPRPTGPTLKASRIGHPGPPRPPLILSSSYVTCAR
jgi:hypothetical protein